MSDRIPIRTIAVLAVLVLALAAGGALGAPGSPVTADDPPPSPYAIEIPKWFTETLLDFREDVADAARERKRVLLYFGQDGCPYCTRLMKVNFSQPDIVAATRASFVAIALNIWGDREVTWTDGRTMTEKELARMLKVQFTPTLLFLDEQGGIALRVNGYQPPERFRAALDHARTHREKDQSFTDYLLQHTPRPAPATATRTVAKRSPLRDSDLNAMLRPARPLLVLFEQSDCRACDEMRAEGFARPDAKRLLQRFGVVRLDLLGSRWIVTPSGKRMREGEWGRALNVAYTPTLVFFDRRGNEVFRTDGYVRPFHLASSLDYVASGAYRDEPNFQRFVKARAEALRGNGTPIDLWR